MLSKTLLLGWAINFFVFAVVGAFFTWLDYKEGRHQERWKLILRYSLIVSQVIIAIMYLVDYIRSYK